MTRDPKGSDRETTIAEDMLVFHKIGGPLTRHSGIYFSHMHPHLASAEMRFRDGSRLVYAEGEWTAEPAVMTPREFHLKLKRIHKRDRGDHEATHSNTDKLTDELLESLGYGAGIEYLRKQTRWCG